MVKKIPVITVDGPSGSGKGTLSQLLAKFLNWHLLDSGALYRVLALAAFKHSINFENIEDITILAAHLDVQFVAALGESAKVMLEGTDVSKEIRSSECGNAASWVAAIDGVRKALLERQRNFLEAPGLVADGRDMGTVVFPEADFKIFLTADIKTRAERRYVQLQEKGINVSLEKILAELIERDKRDTERSAAPLKPAEDAWCLDTTSLNIEEAFFLIQKKVQESFKLK